MEPRIARMQQELKDLQEKLAKLYTFLETDQFKLLPEEEQRLLEMQHYHMYTYSAILQVRLRPNSIGVAVP